MHPIRRERLCQSLTALFIGLAVAILATATAQPLQYNEAPQLAQLVETGELPPVNERLPEEPMVVPVVDRIGEYGGTWNSGIVGIAEFAGCVLKNG